MKKKIWKIASIVVLVVLLAVISAAGTFILIRDKNVKETGNIFGVSWYNETDTEFTITTQEELYEFARLSDFYSFENQTVKLGADIVVNEGNASDWAENRPKLRWTPISGFAGTFDGQGHSISGIYGKNNGSKMALFIDADYSCTVKNVKLVNSYFETSGGRGVASFVSNGGGKFIQLYSDAIFSHNGEFCGGIASRITDQSTFEECWFDGKIELTEGNAGGIVDMISGARVTMKHCLFSGSINQKYDFSTAKTGGICGRVMDGATVVLSDSLACGSIVSDTNSAVGSLFGRTDSGVTFTITDSYVSNMTYDVLVGTKGGSYTGTALAINAKDLEGVKAYQWTTLDFANYWAVTEDSTPILKCFAENVPSLEGIAKGYDVSWYTKGSYNFEIKTKEQLYGLMYLSASNSFTDTIVKLGADIVVNEGKASNWEKKAPELSWYGIRDFTGTFDGQGHTISGLYVNVSDTYAGLFSSVLTNGAVRNVNVKNSYFCSTCENTSAIGSVVGDLRGNMRDVYSDAIVVAYGDQAGGLVGRVNDSDTDGMQDAIEISNCWFDGKLYMKTSDVMQGGGIVGNLVQGDLNISHCLNTGVISSETVDKGVHLGGIIGTVRGKGVLNLSDSLNAGEIVVERDTCVGSVIGRAWDATATVNLTNTYATSESFSRGIGDNSKSTINGGVIQLPETMLTGFNAYKYTELDFPNYWAIVKTDTPILQSFASSDPSVAGIKKLVDTSWYKADAKTLIIDSVEDLYGFAILSRSTDFAGQTVKLGADLTVNAVDVAILSAWANGSATAENLWAPIGTQDKVFAGTFDGQRHTISGLYLKSGMEFAGLFGVTSPTSMVKNFSIKDSYFCYTSEKAQEKEEKIALGSVCGDLRGDMENVYSNAIVHSIGSRVGGLVGITNGAKLDGKLTTSSIKNCWFDGEVKLTGPYARYAGGIAGIAMQGTIELFHCLNTGSISNERETAAQFLGGIIGSDQNPSKVYITDCLNTGSVTAKTYNGVAAILGMAYKEDSVYTLKNVCATDESCVYPNGKTKTYVLYKGSADGYVTHMPEEWYYGTESYEWSTLDFENYFAARQENVPSLKTFVNEGLTYSGTRANTSWYDANATKHHIKNEADFFGFTVLVHSGFGFEEQSVYLDANLKLNKENQWFPIGDNTNLFRGTFDGQNYTIQGVYINSDWKYAGLFGVVSPVGKLKNFSLRDSHIAYTSEESLNKEVKYALGSICGDLRGDMENVYSNAFVTSTASRVGGLVGSANGAKYDGKYTTSTIQNCWFDGEVKLTGPYARYAGGIAGIAMQKDIEILHCLNTGTISNEREDAAQFIGGIIGSENNPSTVYIKDTMNAGTVTSKDTDYNGVSSIIGMTYQADSVYTLENVYATDESCVTPKGKINSYMVYKGTVKGSVASAPKQHYFGTECYKWSLLDYKDYWAARKDDTPSLKYFENQNLKYDGVVADTGWYDAEDEKLYITNVDEFYGFAALVRNGADFKNQTVYLDVKNDELKLDKTVEWLPIGTESNPFRGTFDGQDATISGVSINATGTDIGLFGVTAEGSSIQNFSLKDSKITYTSEESLAAEVKAGIGTVCGTLGGNLINVYSSADIDSTASYVGGLVGVAEGTVTIENCWYDGDVKLSGEYARYAGGILAVANKGTIEITQCLNTGTVTNERTGGAQFIGGLVGTDMTDKTRVNITDCLNAGTIAASNYNGVGSVIGMSYANDSVYTLKNVYAVNESCVDAKGVVHDILSYDKKSSVIKGDLYTLPARYFLGTEGYRWMAMDFANDWVTRDKKTPALKSFAEEELTHDGIIQADITWYKAEDTDLYIKDAADFYGLAKLVNTGTTFEGQIIYLDVEEELKFNETDDNTMASWRAGTTVATNPWVSIGTPEHPFYGTFDGQDKTISGLYMSSLQANVSDNYWGLFGVTYPTSMLKNIRLEKSYLCCTKVSDTKAYIGSVCGEMRGDMQHVYSSAIIDSKSSGVGGIVAGAYGDTTQEGELAIVAIDDCWFGGEVKLTGQKARYAGGIVAVAKRGTIEIANCLNSGSISNERGDAAEFLGGIIGTDEVASQIYISDCLASGIVKANRYNGVASIVGMAYATNTVYTLDNVYTTDKSCSYTTSAATSYTKYKGALKGTDSIVFMAESSYLGTEGYRWTTLDFTEHWAARTGKVPAPKMLVKESERADVSKTIRPDTSWFTGKENTYHLSEEGQFFGLAMLVNNEEKTFSGITIILDEDMELNEVTAGTIDAWKAGTVPENLWTPIGSNDGTIFQGVFDGGGHTISGLYMYSESNQGNGLFGAISGANTKVQNFRLVDSYLKNNNGSSARLGSIVGWAKGGVIQNIYSEATMYSTGVTVGGLVGMIGGNVSIKSCWYGGENAEITVAYTSPADGSNGNTMETGGLLGYAYSGVANIDTCLYSGKIVANYTCNVKDRSGYGANIGGLCGIARQGTQGTLTIANSISAGKVDFTWKESPKAKPSGVAYVGTVCGSAYSSTQSRNTYATTEVKYVIVDAGSNGTITTAAGRGASSGFVVDSSFLGNESQMHGAAGAALLTKLNFTRNTGDTTSLIWTWREGKLPIPEGLSSFCN